MRVRVATSPAWRKPQRTHVVRAFDAWLNPCFNDRLVAVVRAGHTLSKRRATPACYASAAHIGVSRRTVDKGWIEDALALLGLERSRPRVKVSLFGRQAALTVLNAT